MSVVRAVISGGTIAILPSPDLSAVSLYIFECPLNLMKSPVFSVPVSPVTATTDKPALVAPHVIVPVPVPVVLHSSVGLTVKTVCLPLSESI